MYSNVFQLSNMAVWIFVFVKILNCFLKFRSDLTSITNTSFLESAFSAGNWHKHSFLVNNIFFICDQYSKKCCIQASAH